MKKGTKLPLPDIHLSNFGWKYTLPKKDRINALRKACLAFGVKKVYKTLILLKNIQSYDRTNIRNVMGEDIAYLKKLFDELSPLTKEKMRKPKLSMNGGGNEDSNIILEGLEENIELDESDGLLQKITIEKIEYIFKKISKEEYTSLIQSNENCIVKNMTDFHENNVYIGMYSSGEYLGLVRLINRIDYTEIDSFCCDTKLKKLIIKFIIRYIQNTTKSEKILIIINKNSSIIKELLNFWFSENFVIEHIEGDSYIFEKKI